MYMLFMLCVSLCMCMHGQSDRCWTALVVDFNTYWFALSTGGWHRLLQGAVVKCGIPAMAGSVTEAQSRNEGTCIEAEEM